MPRQPSNVIDFYDGQARLLGFESYQALEDATNEEYMQMIDTELENDPEFQAWLRESAEHSNRSK